MTGWPNKVSPSYVPHGQTSLHYIKNLGKYVSQSFQVFLACIMFIFWSSSHWIGPEIHGNVGNSAFVDMPILPFYTSFVSKHKLLIPQSESFGYTCTITEQFLNYSHQIQLCIIMIKILPMAEDMHFCSFLVTSKVEILMFSHETNAKLNIFWTFSTRTAS